MKGIILAGGSGTRLYPLTKVTSKQLLPVHDKPMIYYPLSILMLAEIRDIMIISTPNDINNFEILLGSGKELGLKLTYAVQKEPKGLAEAFIIAEEFIGTDSVAMILGDNIYYGNGLTKILKEAKEKTKLGIASIFGYHVNDPHRFGIVEFDENEKVISVVEKPKEPKSNYCITGMYFYDNKVVEMAKKVKPSDRNELEITDINNMYLKNNSLEVKLLGRGYAWMDAGTIESLYEASEFVKVVEERQSIKIAALEEIAYNNHWINKEQLLKSIDIYKKSSYGVHLRKVAENKILY